jgi:3-(3-hydroxy-phenyl)propionate hydroxylase
VQRTLRTRGIAGHLCPNVLLDNGSRLDEKLGMGFGVVAAAPLSPAQRDTVAARGATIVHAAPGSDLARWLRRHHVTAAVVRPDRTVMFAGRDLDSVCRAVPLYLLDHPNATRNAHTAAGSSPHAPRTGPDT